MTRGKLKTLRSWLLMLLLGATTAYFGYPKVGFWPLAVIGPAILFAVAARTQKPVTASILGLFYGIGFHLALIYWIVGTIKNYGGIPLTLSLTAYFLLVAYLALYPAMVARLVSHAASRSADGAIFLAPFAWTGLEWMRARFMSGFGWGDVSQALWSQSWALDLGPRVGSRGAELLVMILATILTWGLMRLSSRRNRPGTRTLLFPSAGLALIILIPLIPDGVSEVTTPKKVIIVQGNIDQAKKWEPKLRAETVGIHRNLTLEAVAREGGADLVVWPETAFPSYFQITSSLRKIVEDTAREAKTPIIFGAPAFEVLADGKKTHRNSVFAVNSDGVSEGRYDKMHLVPFGEYVPLPKLLFFIKRMVFAAGDFTPGEKTVRFKPDADSPTVGPLVCFESIFPDYALDHAEGGAQILALVTNDAWFGLTNAPWQHLAYAAWRAAETGLPLVRAANTGVSAVFDRKGRLLMIGPQSVPTTLSAVVLCPEPGVPLAAHLEHFFGPGCLLLAAAAFFVNLRLPGNDSRYHG